MKKSKTVVAILFLIVALGASSYIYFNQQVAFEQFFKFDEDYVKTKDGDITIYRAQEVLFDTEAVLDRIEPTKQLAQDILKKDYKTHKSLPIFVTLPGYKGHEKMGANTGVYIDNMGIIFINGENAQFSSYTAVHEYSHFLFDLYLSENGISIQEIPAWFTEGIAEYFSFKIEQALPTFYTYYFNTFPFDKLHEINSGNVNTIYLQGFYAIFDLIESYDEDVITQIISSYKTSGDFSAAFEEVTDENYAEYHDNFRLNKNKIDLLADQLSEPEKVLETGEQLLANQASINPYSPFILPYLVSAAIELNEISLAKTYLDSLDQLLFNPNDYLYFAVQFQEAGEHSIAAKLIEKGRYFGKAYHYVLELYEREAEKILTSEEL
ncbi:collagenase [Solibacillus sp. FSL W7-1324]|uniref:collagenase n=1 Tax=Solibacillus sp. FSL W7-1324 TaxID=2921701 RepID=UPI0030F9D349